MMNIHEQLFELKQKFETAQYDFLKEKAAMLTALRSRDQNKDGWKRYRDCQAMYSSANKFLNLLEYEVNTACSYANPKNKNVEDVKFAFSFFEDAWQKAKEAAFFGVLH